MILSCIQCGSGVISPVLNNTLRVQSEGMRVDAVKNLPSVTTVQAVKRRIDTVDAEANRRPCQDITNVTSALCSPPKRVKNAPMTVTSKEMAAFFKIFGEGLLCSLMSSSEY